MTAMPVKALMITESKELFFHSSDQIRRMPTKTKASARPRMILLPPTRLDHRAPIWAQRMTPTARIAVRRVH
jgi:hypothetical protein